ncbi:MAG: outer membrane beta-barrel protein [Deltaproteobacteria bacterium]|nr:outer membrane beta-barrel protein [Deltaproteobacteria bacterium]
MKVLGCTFFCLLAVLILAAAGPAMAVGDDPPVDSGFSIFLVPEVHVYDFGSTFEWEDDQGGKTYKAEDDLKINQSGGFGVMFQYNTASPVFIALEAAHHTYLGTALRSEFDDFEDQITQEESDDRLTVRLASGRVGGLLGLYFKGVSGTPYRPYIAAGAGYNMQQLEFLGRKFDGTAINVSGLFGVDFYASRHLALGAGLRADYMMGEEYEGDYTAKGSDHSIKATYSRIPLNLFVKLGYMF